MKKIRILIADDEPLARRGVRQMLAQYEDMDVVGECRNGWETLRAIETLAPDLLFLDVQMPEMDGFQATKVIRETMKIQPWIIAVTANAMQSDRKECIEAGMNDYISKPINFETLVKALETASRELVKL